MTECDYELERERRIAENRRKIQELGVLEGALDLRTQRQQSAPRRGGESRAAGGAAKRKAKPQTEPGEIRKSARETKRPNYREEDFFDSSILKGGTTRTNRAGGGGRTGRIVDEEELKTLREAFAAGIGHGPAARGVVDSGRGVRIQGGRIYDSALGVSCHWCRQKTLEDHVTCTSLSCGGGKRMPISFCKMCLRNRHGEDVHTAKASGQWVCPMCRGSCGPGCGNCCNCGPCRKKVGLAPTHQLAREAKASGFSNVHDYLIHLETGEDQEEIGERKAKHEWGRWLCMPRLTQTAPPATVTAVFSQRKPSSKKAAKSQEPKIVPDGSIPSARRSARLRTA